LSQNITVTLNVTKIINLLLTLLGQTKGKRRGSTLCHSFVKWGKRANNNNNNNIY